MVNTYFDLVYQKQITVDSSTFTLDVVDFASGADKTFRDQQVRSPVRLYVFLTLEAYAIVTDRAMRWIRFDLQC